MERIVEKKNVCVFISSTFIDMEVERDIINNEILNQLRDDFSGVNVDIYFVDLRWGINTVDVDNNKKRNEKILKVCMSEIDRCHPYFIGLLGKRYGWTPDDELLYSCFVEKEIKECKQFFSVDKLSVTALETYHALVQKELNHERCFICHRTESAYSQIPEEFRDNYIDIENRRELDCFQSRVISLFSGNRNSSNFINYSGKWEKNCFVPDRTFYNSLYKGLHDAIQRDLNRDLSFSNEIEEENYYQELFAERIANGTIVRHNMICEIENKLIEENGGIILHAPSGQGKSTFLCQLYRHLKSNKGVEVLFYSAVANRNSSSMGNLIVSFAYRIAAVLGEEYKIIEKNNHNILSNTDFQDFSSLIGKGGYEYNNVKEEMSYEQLVINRLVQLIAKYKKIGEKQIVFLIDAYDRFECSFLLHSLKWLKTLNVAFVITSTTDNVINNKIFSTFLKMELPGFSRENALEYICNNCYGKELHSSVINTILGKKNENGNYAYASPLWLKLMVHVLTSLDISDFLNIDLLQEEDKEKRIHNYMQNIIRQTPSTPGEALIFFIDKAETYIGREFSTEVLLLLAFSNFGLREKDLQCLMGDNWSTLDFAVLHRWIRPYLMIGNHSQWYLAHQLFVDTLTNKYKDNALSIYDRLLDYCLKLPSDDVIRIKTGMLNAIYAQSLYMNALHYYTFECRIPESIQQATNILTNHIMLDPEYLNALIEMYEEMNGSNYDRFTTERLLFTLGTQLYKQGMCKQAKQLYLFFEPILECNLDGLYVKEILLPMVYDRLAFIYGEEYNMEMSDYYKTKSQQLIGKFVTSGDDSSNDEELALDYTNIIHNLYDQSNNQENPYDEDLFDSRFYNEEWRKSVIDELLYVMGNIYACISCPPYHPQFEKWKNELPNAINRYYNILPSDDVEWEMEIETSKNNIFYKFDTILLFMEFLIKRFVKSNRDFALRMQHDCLCLYRSIANSQQNEHYLDECALGHQLAGNFYQNNGEIDKAVEAYSLGLKYSSYALNIYPNSIRINKRYLFVNHALGECLFNICRFDEALQHLVVYHDGIKEILDNDPSQLTMVTSYINALYTIGRCYVYMHKYNDALYYLTTMQSSIEDNLDNAPQAIYFTWVTMLFNSKYFIARCHIESGNEETGYTYANELYNTLLLNGIPHDSEYEPMENIRELLGL